jgi:type I restriction enzyme S subunit
MNNTTFGSVYLESVPSDWEQKQLGDVVTNVNKRYKNLEEEKALPVYSVTNSNGFQPSEDTFDKEVYSEELSDYQVVEPGQFAYNPSRIDVGSIAMLSNETPVLISPMYEVFETTPEVLDRFLFHFVKSKWALSLFEAYSQGSVRQTLKFSLFAQLPLPYPTKSEQRRISDFLDNLELSINHIDEIIEESKRLKKGVMSQLFAHGIGDNKHQQVRMGPKTPKFPNSWDIVSLDELSSKMRNGFVGTATPYYSDGSKAVPYLQSTNIRENYIDESNLTKVEPEFHQKNPETQLRAGDMLTVQSGHIGTSCVVPERFEGANCHALIITRLDTSRVLPEFVAYFLNSPLGKAVQKSIAVGSTVEHINVGHFKNIEIPIPSVDEQKEIVEKISVFDEEINLNSELCQEMSTLKKGLTHKLLTGDIRINPATKSRYA